MKKKFMHGRLGSAVLALLLAVAMCVSPLSSLKAEAASTVTIKAVDVPAEFEEGVDMSQYFHIYVDGTDYEQESYAYLYRYEYVWNSETGSYDTVESFYGTEEVGQEIGEDCKPISAAFEMSYTDAEGKEVEGIPTEPGTYKATASLTRTSYVFYDFCYISYDNSEEGEWVDTDYLSTLTGSVEYTIKDKSEEPGTEEPGTEEPGTEEPGTEEPDSSLGDGIVEFQAANGTELAFEEGEKIDLTDEFVLYWNDEPLTFMQDRNYTSYYSKDTAPEGAMTMEDAYTVCYYDADMNELLSAPTESGTYYAMARLTSSDIYYWTGLYNWVHSENVLSEVITFTIGDGDDGSDAGAVIKFLGGWQVFEEGEEIDLSGCFTVNYDGVEVYALCDYETGAYYYAEYEPLISELLVYTYCDAEGNILDGVPTEPGVYGVSASFPEGYIYAYADENTGIAYISPEATPFYKVTIVAAETEDEKLYEGLHLNYIGETTEFEATGEPVDLSKAFTFEFMGVEPVIIFQGYLGDDGNWIWGTGTDKDYENYSNCFEDYVPFYELYVVHYWDAEGNELAEAPSEPGDYYVSADIPDITADGGKRCIYLKYGYDEETYVITEDEHYFYYGVADSGLIPFTIKGEDAGTKAETDDKKAETDDKKAGTDDKKAGIDDKKADKTGTSAKTGDTAPIALYIILIAACGIVAAAIIHRRKENAR